MWFFVKLVVFIYIILKIARFYFSRYVWGSLNPEDERDVTDKIVLITGANAGIGKRTAYELARRKAIVVMACRNIEAAEKAKMELVQEASDMKLRIEIMELDLSSLDSIRKFAKSFKNKYSKCDILINNAGVMLPPEKEDFTKDNFEIHFGVNHLGHFLLTNLLLPEIKNAAPSRIITLSSIAHQYGKLDFDDLTMKNSTVKERTVSMLGGFNKRYSNSKLANLMFSIELAERLKGTGVNTYALCPGVVYTDLGRNMSLAAIFKIFEPVATMILQTPSEGCRTTLYCALSKTCTSQTGEMYQHCGLWKKCDRIPISLEDCKKLWKISEKLVNLC